MVGPLGAEGAGKSCVLFSPTVSRIILGSKSSTIGNTSDSNILGVNIVSRITGKLIISKPTSTKSTSINNATGCSFGCNFVSGSIDTSEIIVSINNETSVICGSNKSGCCGIKISAISSGDNSGNNSEIIIFK